MKLIIDELLNLNNEELILEGKNYVAPKSESYESLNILEQKPITAIDGGSAILLETPSFCISFVRIVAINFKKTEDKFQKIITKKEGYVFSFIKDNNIITKFFDEKTKQLNELFIIKIDELDSLNVAINLGRKLLEWDLVLNSEGAILWDGSFTPQTKIEEKVLNSLIGKTILGLAKTTTANFNAYFKNAPNLIWRTKIKNEPFETYFVKLHNKGRIFRVDKLGSFDIKDLVSWSNDPVFFGYPYPLIIADQLARISNQETEALKIKLQVSAGKEWAQLTANSLDSHSILDKIQF